MENINSNINIEAVVRLKNLFKDFDDWSKFHYFAMKNRAQYPNLFFYYFPYDGYLKEHMNREEIGIILTALKKHKNEIKGMWGFLSILLENKNGIRLYEWLSNSEYFDSSLSMPCKQEGKPDFSKTVMVSIILKLE
jgi:hypothetical protein